MDDIRFDAWTRRRFGLALGGGAAMLLGLSARDHSAAKKRKKPCRRLKQGCQPGNRNKRCCKKLACGEIAGLGGHHCCRPLRGLCEAKSDCCGDLDCFTIGGLVGETRCCVEVDGDCAIDQDCCGNLTCRQERGRCEGK
jgi:hypothetical protein